MRGILKLFPISAAEADRAARVIASLGSDLRTTLESFAVAAALVIGLPAAILGLMILESAL